MTGEMDGSVRIAWTAEGYDAIRVYARRRAQEELAWLATRVADVALLNRSVHTLRSALRREFGATFDVEPGADRGGGHESEVLVVFHPPRGEPNPDPDY